MVTVCDAIVAQALPLRRWRRTAHLVNGPLLVVESWPVIEKGCLTGAEEGAEIVRAAVVLAEGVEGFASIAGVALQNNNAQLTTTTSATITTLFPANIPTHLER